METMNKIEYTEIENKAKQIEELTTIVENTFNKMDFLIDKNINSGIGIWDGEDAKKFKEEWINIKENIPSIINVYRIQANNINKLIDNTTKNSIL